jgi:rhodanese-related sulfurtransferase
MPSRRRSIVALFFVAILSVAGCSASDESADGKPAVQEISQQDLLSNPPEGVLILDVRTPGEYGESHVPNAINISHNELAARLSELNSSSDRAIVVYCKSGRRAGMAAKVLQGAGYTDLHHLSGDMDGWKAAGLPTE